MGRPGLFLWLLGFWVAVRVTGALYRIPYLSLGAELSSDYDERTMIFGIRALFGLVGALVAAAFSFLVFGAKTGGLDPKLDYVSYPKMGLLFGLLMSLTAVISTVGTLSHRSTGESGRAYRPPCALYHGIRFGHAQRDVWPVWFTS